MEEGWDISEEKTELERFKAEQIDDIEEFLDKELPNAISKHQSALRRFTNTISISIAKDVINISEKLKDKFVILKSKLEETSFETAVFEEEQFVYLEFIDHLSVLNYPSLVHYFLDRTGSILSESIEYAWNENGIEDPFEVSSMKIASLSDDDQQNLEFILVNYSGYKAYLSNLEKYLREFDDKFAKFNTWIENINSV
jgi:hypothetical protein